MVGVFVEEFEEDSGDVCGLLRVSVGVSAAFGEADEAVVVEIVLGEEFEEEVTGKCLQDEQK